MVLYLVPNAAYQLFFILIFYEIKLTIELLDSNKNSNFPVIHSFLKRERERDVANVSGR